MDNDAEVDRITTPVFEFPWSGACHSDVADVEQSMIAWGTDHQLIPDEDYLNRVIRTRYGYLAARCYPRAERVLLQIIADYFLWFFLADDLFVDRVETVASENIQNLTAMIDVLDFDHQGSSPVYGESAWLDVCRRLRQRLSFEHFERFATGMRLWASTAGLQILNHLRPRSVGVETYQTIRRHTSGMNPCLALSDVANLGSIAPAEYHDPAVHQLRMHANNIVCWSNDIQSLVVETRQPGQFRNFVTILAAEERTLQEAVDVAAHRVRSEISAFTELSEVVQRQASRQLSGYVVGLKDWVRGYQDWVTIDTWRYSTTRASRDADDRGVVAKIQPFRRG
jgi:hypothetical protein